MSGILENLLLEVHCLFLLLSSTNTNSNENLSVVLQFFIPIFSSDSELLLLAVIIVTQYFHCDLHS